MLEVMTNNTPLFLTGVFVLGSLFGSFLNVVILRQPARLKHEWRCQCKELLDITPYIVMTYIKCYHTAKQ